MRGWPPFQTPAGAHKVLQTRHWFFALTTALIGVPLLAFIYVLLTPSLGFPSRDSADLLQFLGTLVSVGVLAIPALFVGGLVLEIALRLGWGGWVTALLTGGLIALVYCNLVAGIPLRDIFDAGAIALLGLPYAGVFWLLLRIQVPRAFSRDASTTPNRSELP